MMALIIEWVVISILIVICDWLTGGANDEKSED